MHSTFFLASTFLAHIVSFHNSFILAASQAFRTTRVDPENGKRKRNFVRWSSLSLISHRGTPDNGPSTRTYKEYKKS